MRKRSTSPSPSSSTENDKMSQNTSSVGDETSFWTPVVACILITETAERFSYFGFRAVLVLFFTRALQYEEPTAIALFAYMTCLAYLSPLAGALLADGHLGRYRTILWFGGTYSMGLSILTTGAYLDSEEKLGIKRLLTFVGLFLVCLGTGGIKPCVSAFGADQVAKMPAGSVDVDVDDGIEGLELESSISFQPTERSNGSLSETDLASVGDGKSKRVRAFFISFYFCINLGALASIFLVPIIRAHFGFGASFLAPTLFLFFAMGAFLSKRNEYVHHDSGQDGSSLATTFRLCWWLLRRRLSNYPVVARCIPWLRPSRAPVTSTAVEVPMTPLDNDSGDETQDPPIETQPYGEPVSDDEQLRDAAQALHVLPVMFMLPVFWTLYDQQGSVWTLQATRMSLHGLEPEQMNVVNPVEIMLFIPIFDRFIYPALEARGWNISHLRRMAYGMLLSSLSFFVSGLLESVMQSRDRQGVEQVHVLWQLPQITILSVAEILLSVTGLEFAYSTSPERLKAFLMAIYLLMTAVGDFLGGILYSSVFQELNRATVLHVCAILMLLNLGLFCLVARW